MINFLLLVLFIIPFAIFYAGLVDLCLSTWGLPPLYVGFGWGVLTTGTGMIINEVVRIVRVDNDRG